jgi:hypothetical protein
MTWDYFTEYFVVGKVLFFLKVGANKYLPFVLLYSKYNFGMANLVNKQAIDENLSLIELMEKVLVED